MSRLVDSPVFILGSVRSGSTLLRCILDSHSRIRAPHELHLGDLRVEASGRYAPLAMQAAGLDCEELEHLLWDRILHCELVTSGKDLIVDKTPSSVLRWRRIARCWPAARYVFLLRHPAAILASALATRRPDHGRDEVTDMVVEFLDAVRGALPVLTGLTVRYEDLVSDPRGTMTRVCAYLGVSFEPGMLDYGRWDHGPLLRGVGDFGERIRSGRVLPDGDGPAGVVPARLRPALVEWGYVDAEVGS